MNYEVFGAWSDDWGSESLGVFLDKDFVDSFMAGQKRRFIYGFFPETITFKKIFGHEFFYNCYSYNRAATDVFSQIFNMGYMKVPEAVAAAITQSDYDYGTKYNTEHLMRKLFYSYARFKNACLLRRLLLAAGHESLAQMLEAEIAATKAAWMAVDCGLRALGVADEPSDYLDLYDLAVEIYQYVLDSTKEEHVSFHVASDFPDFPGWFPTLPTDDEVKAVLRKYDVDTDDFFKVWRR